jgi:TIR domain/Pentapeptide repeats (8 copies)
MADQEQLAILQQGREVWNTWRREHPTTRPDLSGANLGHANLSGANFYQAKLGDANISHTNLSKAVLRGAFLSDANLSNADLSNADLSFAGLLHVNLNHANLNDANLSYANLGHANLSVADLIDANLDHAHLNSADLSNAHLSGAHLSNADLNDAHLIEADLSDTDLSYAAVGDTIFANVDLRNIKGLETVRHLGPSTIGTDTLERSQGDIPEVFLRGAGLSETFIEYAHALVHKPIDYYTCFISYSSKDEAFARRLYSDLQSTGVRCWFAPEDMKVGDKIRQRINESIRLYEKLLLVLSKHSITSSWVAYEVERALNKEPQGAPHVLYPIRLDKAILTCETEWAQDIKQTRHIGNFERWKTNHDAYQDNFNRLLHALQSDKTTKKDTTED